MKVKIKLLMLLLFSISSLVVAMINDIPASVKPIASEVGNSVSVKPVISALSIKFGTQEGVRTIDYHGGQAQHIANLLKNTDFFKSIIERWQTGEKMVIKLPEISKEQFERFTIYIDIAQKVEEQKGENTALFFDAIALDELYDVALTASFFGAHMLLKFVAPAIAWREMQQFKKTGNFSHYLRDIPQEITQEWVKFVPDVLKDIMPNLVLPVTSAQPIVDMAQESFEQFPTVENGRIQLWDVFSGNLAQEITTQDKPVVKLHMWTFDNVQFLLVEYTDASFDVWNITTQQLMFSKNSTDDQQIIDVFKPNKYEKNFIVTLYANDTAQIWDLTNNQEVVLLKDLIYEKGEDVWWDAKKIVIGNQVWDYNNNRILTTLDMHKDEKSNRIFPLISRNGEKLVSIDQENGIINIVSTVPEKNNISVKVLYKDRKYPIGTYDVSNYIAISPELKINPETNESLYINIPVKIFDLFGNVIAELDHDNEAIVFVKIVDDKYLLATTAKGSLFVWDLPSGKRLQKVALLEAGEAYIGEVNVELGLAIVYENNFIPDTSTSSPGDIQLIYYLIDFKSGTILNTFRYEQPGAWAFTRLGEFVASFPQVTPYGFINKRESGVIFSKENSADSKDFVTVYYLDKNYLGRLSFEQIILIELLKEQQKTGGNFATLLKNSYSLNMFDSLPLELKNAIAPVAKANKSKSVVAPTLEELQLVAEALVEEHGLELTYLAFHEGLEQFQFMHELE